MLLKSQFLNSVDKNPMLSALQSVKTTESQLVSRNNAESMFAADRSVSLIKDWEKIALVRFLPLNSVSTEVKSVLLKSPRVPAPDRDWET